MEFSSTLIPLTFTLAPFDEMPELACNLGPQRIFAAC
jgi:hypothetical protein